jgi:cyanophycin synthetase
VELASDKEETNKILATLGLPVPKQELVQSADGAVRAARRIGYPVVTKPYNGNHGRGISIHLKTEEAVRAASPAAQRVSRSVIVETYLTGDDHRLLVVNGELVAATRRTPGHVVGDGTCTIAQLVDVVNQDPRRGIGHEKVLTRLELDAQAERCSREKGYTAATVPEARARRSTCATANLSTGGTATDVTDVIHPDNARWRCAPSRRSASTSAAWTSSRPTSRELQEARRRHLRGQRRAGLPHARGAERRHARATSPGR